MLLGTWSTMSVATSRSNVRGPGTSTSARAPPCAHPRGAPHTQQPGPRAPRARGTGARPPSAAAGPGRGPPPAGTDAEGGERRAPGARRPRRAGADKGARFARSLVHDGSLSSSLDTLAGCDMSSATPKGPPSRRRNTAAPSRRVTAISRVRRQGVRSARDPAHARWSMGRRAAARPSSAPLALSPACGARRSRRRGGHAPRSRSGRGLRRGGRGRRGPRRSLASSRHTRRRSACRRGRAPTPKTRCGVRLPRRAPRSTRVTVLRSRRPTAPDRRDILLRRLREPRRFLQILAGPRQVGKTTIAREVLRVCGLPQLYASADGPSPPSAGWMTSSGTPPRSSRATRPAAPSGHKHPIIRDAPGVLAAGRPQVPEHPGCSGGSGRRAATSTRSSWMLQGFWPPGYNNVPPARRARPRAPPSTQSSAPTNPASSDPFPRARGRYPKGGDRRRAGLRRAASAPADSTRPASAGAPHPLRHLAQTFTVRPISSRISRHRS